MAQILPSINQNNLGMYVENTFVWEIDLLQDIDVSSPAFKELLVRLYQNLNKVVLALNKKDSGLYPYREFQTGKIYNLDQPIYRMTVACGTLPNNTTLVVPHGIVVENSLFWIYIGGAATDQVALTGIPLPYTETSVSTAAINVAVDNTNIYITTTSDYSAYTISQIMLEFVKS